MSNREVELHAAGEAIASLVGDDPPRAVTGVAFMPHSPAGEPRQQVEPEPPTQENIAQLLKDFGNHLEQLQVGLPMSVIIDALTAYLSSQFLLLAGPSGTGKSTLGRALASFFCHDDSWEVLEARRQLVGPEELVGYVSPLAQGRYFPGTELKALLTIARPGGGSPALLVEEMNLSPVEGYLAPFTHGLSALANPSVEWSLHDTEILDPPRRLRFAPYPRLLGTINVDATAHAPAPKVAARASVVLLESGEDPDLAAVIQATTTLETLQTSDRRGKGAHLVGSPTAALGAELTAVKDLEMGLAHGLDLLSSTSDPVRLSRRQLGQMACYMAWFTPITRAAAATLDEAIDDPTAGRLGAENALLHHVLPSLPARDLERALAALAEGTGVVLNPEVSALGGLLQNRVEALNDAAAGSIVGGQALDFWERLS